ncbi:MAG: hypothetical protein FWD31_00805 [Planctomycetaceae bacterium]|nr:hypothetical protein [Planctomycetaceae bacterium]
MLLFCGHLTQGCGCALHSVVALVALAKYHCPLRGDAHFALCTLHFALCTLHFALPHNLLIAPIALFLLLINLRPLQFALFLLLISSHPLPLSKVPYRFQQICRQAPILTSLRTNDRHKLRFADDFSDFAGFSRVFWAARYVYSDHFDAFWAARDAYSDNFDAFGHKNDAF